MFETKLNAYPTIPDLECPLCNGTGYDTTTVGVRKVCPCVLKKKAQMFLTPLYKESSKSFSAMDSLQKEISKNLKPIDIFISKSLIVFKDFVKSYLLNRGCSDVHLTCSAYDLVQSYVLGAKLEESSDSFEWNRPITSDQDPRIQKSPVYFLNKLPTKSHLPLTLVRELPDLLVIILDRDPDNRSYSNLLPYVLSHRKNFLNKRTFIYSPLDIGSSLFQSKYSLDVTEFLYSCAREESALIYNLDSRKDLVGNMFNISESIPASEDVKSSVTSILDTPVSLPQRQPRGYSPYAPRQKRDEHFPFPQEKRTLWQRTSNQPNEEDGGFSFELPKQRQKSWK